MPQSGPPGISQNGRGPFCGPRVGETLVRLWSSLPMRKLKRGLDQGKAVTAPNELLDRLGYMGPWYAFSILSKDKGPLVAQL